MILRHDQAEDLRKARQALTFNNAFLIASSTGVGKTRVALHVANDYQRVLIVAPLSTKAGWENEAAIVAFDWSQEHVWVNYESLRKIKPQAWDLVIWDECQKLCSYKAKRRKQFLDLRKRARKILFLSATPGQSPLNLHYLGDVIGFDPEYGFWKWAGGFRGLFRNRWNGIEFKSGFIEDTVKLQGVVQGNPRALRRTPEEIAGWPELQRIINPVSLTAHELSVYESAFKDYLEANKGRPLSAIVKNLIAAGQFRKRLSELKVKATVDLARTHLEGGKVVCVSCEYLEPAHKIFEALSMAGFDCAIITGETPSHGREMILNQSKADALDAIVFTIQEGINLQQFEDKHRERLQIIHDVRWSALQQHQIEGRVHRNGRFAPVYWMTAQGTIDDRVARRLSERMNVLSHIAGDSLMEEILEEEINFQEKC